MCALLLTGDEPPVPPSHQPMAVTWLLYMVCLQQECSKPCSPCSCAKCGAPNMLSAKILAPHLSCTEGIPRTWPWPARSSHTVAFLARSISMVNGSGLLH